jgi:hypothetical protein
MTREESVRLLASSVDENVRLFIDEARIDVHIISVHVDGVLCHSVPISENEPESEFWVAYDDIRLVERL